MATPVTFLDLTGHYLQPSEFKQALDCNVQRATLYLSNNPIIPFASFYQKQCRNITLLMI